MYVYLPACLPACPYPIIYVVFVCLCIGVLVFLLSLQLFYRFESFLTAGEIYYCDLTVSPVAPTVSCNGTFFIDWKDLYNAKNLLCS